VDTKKIEERAKEHFGMNRLFCAESVLLTVSEELGIDSPLIPKIATGFCGGMAHTCGTCGAVAGAVMAIGLVYGRDKGKQPYGPVYEIVQQFFQAFEDEFKSTNCLELTGCDLNTEEGRQAFVDRGVMGKCKRFTGKAAALVAKLIDEEKAE
jgi:C_GCAxxG_C_C family probable redox protein